MAPQYTTNFPCVTYLLSWATWTQKTKSLFKHIWKQAEALIHSMHTAAPTMVKTASHSQIHEFRAQYVSVHDSIVC